MRDARAIRAAAAIAIIVGVAACSGQPVVGPYHSDAGDGSVAGDAGGYVPVAPLDCGTLPPDRAAVLAFYADYARASCDQLARCPEPVSAWFYPLLVHPDSCVGAYERIFFECPTDATAAGWDAASAAACLDATRTACPHAVTGARRLVDPCEGATALARDQPAGASCEGSTCASGLACTGLSGGRQCATPPPLGASCMHDGECAPAGTADVACVPAPGFTARGHCAHVTVDAAGTSGMPCGYFAEDASGASYRDCADGLTCAGIGTSGTCLAPGAEGASCVARVLTNCAAGLVCPAGTCMPVMLGTRVGARCDDTTAICDDLAGLGCNGTTCVPLGSVPAGAACGLSWPYNLCASGLYCGTAGTCTAP